MEITIQQKFQAALEQFIEIIQQDHNIIAAILMGSLAYDQVWEKSDIDMCVVVKEQKLVTEYYCININDIIINLTVRTRDHYRKWVEGTLQSSISHSLMVKGKLLFTCDDSFTEYFENIRYIGNRDKELQLMMIGAWTLGNLDKVEKWLYIKKDVQYSYLWVTKVLELLSQIEVILHDIVPMRESIQQALVLNPSFFNSIYTDLINRPKQEEDIQQALLLIKEYMKERMYVLFAPILKYLAVEKGVRGISEIYNHFKKKSTSIDTYVLLEALEFLSSQGIVEKTSLPVRLTPKSRIEVEEAAYFYDRGEL